MINCDLCGKVEESLNRALVEGVELEVCPACAKFGKIITPVHRPGPKEQHRQLQRQTHAKEQKENIEILVENYAEIIKKKRESMGSNQKDFATRLNEKESTIHHIETGKLEPNLALARKLEKMLGVKLIEGYKEEQISFKLKKEGSFTLGDFIKVKK